MLVLEPGLQLHEQSKKMWLEHDSSLHATNEVAGLYEQSSNVKFSFSRKAAL